MADVRKASRLWTPIGLGLYACVCLVLFMWMRFPYDSLKYRAENALSGVFGAPVTLGHIEPSLLRGYKIQGVAIGGDQVATRLIITPRPWEIFRRSLGFGYHADLVTGAAEGRMRLPFRKSSRPLELTLDMANVDLKGFSKILPPNKILSGTVNGELRVTTPRESIEKAIGSLTLSWKNGSLPLGMPTLPVDALVFENLDLEGTIDNGLLSLDKVEITGDFSGTMTGSIRLSRDVRKSRLNLAGELSLPESLRTALGTDSASSGQGARFSLRGSIEKPRFRMLGSYAGRMARRPAASPAPSIQAPSNAVRDAITRARRQAAQPPQAGGPSEAEEEEFLDLEPDEVELQQPIEPEGEEHE